MTCRRRRPASAGGPVEVRQSFGRNAEKVETANRRPGQHCAGNAQLPPSPARTCRPGPRGGRHGRGGRACARSRSPPSRGWRGSRRGLGKPPAVPKSRSRRSASSEPHYLEPFAVGNRGNRRLAGMFSDGRGWFRTSDLSRVKRRRNGRLSQSLRSGISIATLLCETDASRFDAITARLGTKRGLVPFRRR